MVSKLPVTVKISHDDYIIPFRINSVLYWFRFSDKKEVIPLQEIFTEYG